MQSFVVDKFGHKRDLKHAVITHWLMEPLARANTDIVLFHTSQQPSHLRWADFPERPWGSEPLTRCSCSEPQSSGGAMRAWKWERLPKRVLEKACEVQVTCTWCGSQASWSRPAGIPPLQMIGDTCFVEYGFPRVDIVFDDHELTSGSP